MTTLRPELLDELLADYETAEDLLGVVRRGPLTFPFVVFTTGQHTYRRPVTKPDNICGC